jgi:carbon-monoxide dehydrogenase small subunit
LAATDGAEITTVEGLGSPTDLTQVQAAFDQYYAAQCGFCTSGMLIAAQALIQSGGGHSRQEVIEALSGHVCRCTGYVKIVDAVTAAASGDVQAESVEPDMGEQGQDAVTMLPGSPA